MIVWGGIDIPAVGDTAFGDGARYDPVSDSWTPVSPSGAPTARYLHTAVWTGEEMIVWGGAGGPFGNATGPGARYRPGSNTWSPTAPGPPDRVRHLAAWTGTEMIVWGGASDDTGNGMTNRGDRYDPVTDSWTIMSASGAPGARQSEAGAWAGDRFMVWGGADSFSLVYDDGAVYDPVTDSWVATSTIGAPSERHRHSAIAAGDRVIIWGGIAPFPGPVSGGIYDIVSDTWTSTAGPFEEADVRSGHGVVWTGSEMIIWGGDNNDDTGARYALGQSSDDDGDGLSECAGDCNDAAVDVFPGAPEICDGLDNDCDDDIPAVENDSDVDDWRICEGDCDDADGNTFPDAPEINDGLDNQCPGDLGHGIIDEISGASLFTSNTAFRWIRQSMASDFLVVRSDQSDFLANCTTFTTTGRFISDPEFPSLDEAFFYLVRAEAPNLGSWGQDSSGVERTICVL